MKRALLIAGGTVGGLGAVLLITPPQLGSHGMTNLSSGANGAGNGTLTASAASSQTTKAVVPQTTSNVVSAPASSVKTSVAPKVIVKKSKKKTTSIKSAAQTNAQAVASTPVSTPTVAVATNSTAPAPVTKKVSGTFVGSSVFVNYGYVQVELTLLDGKITDARALQAPSGQSDRFTKYAVPVLRQQTLAAQSAHIQGASGASYTSYGWYTSLQVALAKAGL